jgi:uncharacterized protein YcnI
MRAFVRLVGVAGFASLLASVAFAHIKISPVNSTYGAREKYMMLVPNEKQVATVKITGEFPSALKVYDFEFKPGWKIDFTKDDKGNIVGATWTGTIAPYEYVEFGMLGINPKEGGPLVWKFTQYYADGKTEDFTGPVGSSYPSPVVTLTAAP